MTTSTPSTTTRTRPSVRGRQPSEQAIDAAIDAATGLLRLPTLRTATARSPTPLGVSSLSFGAFLSELLLAECDDREERRAARRVAEAGFSRPKSLADFDFTANTAINPATINTLAGCGWVSKGQSLCLIGTAAPASPTCSSAWGPPPPTRRENAGGVCPSGRSGVGSCSHEP